ncbi:MAG: C25 family cysteine peptidase, partial [Acidobacteriota bacterium]
GGSVSLRVEAGHRYELASGEGLLVPRVSQPLRSTLRRSTNQAEYVVITPEAFLEAARPLVEHRQDQGLTAKVVSFEEITSEFGHGRPSARAIRDFLAYAYHSWKEPSLRYVLLLGDSSSDPRNFTGFDQGAPLPAMWVKTSYLWTASDPTLGAVNGEDLLPDVAVGRLPAKTLQEAHALVQKVLAWEGSAQDLSGTAVLVADNPDEAGDFEADLLDIRASFLGGRPTKTLFVRELGGRTRGEILTSFDAGASLLSYVGHGGAAVWASENVLNSWDTEALRVQSRQPLMLTFNCLNGYFVAPSYDSLSEAFLKEEGRGTIGAFSPSGLSVDGPAHRFHRALMAEITSGEHARLGDAVLAAQAAYAEEGVMPELLAIYQLLADPGLTIR